MPDLDFPSKTDPEAIKAIVNKLVKSDPKFTCCDNIDMEELVLKSSIVPCSNLIPDKYKKYGESYNSNIRQEDDNNENNENNRELHPHRINDKFSIIFITFIIINIDEYFIGYLFN